MIPYMVIYSVYYGFICVFFKIRSGLLIVVWKENPSKYILLKENLML